jgi:hypothetical protein
LAGACKTAPGWSQSCDRQQAQADHAIAAGRGTG